MVGGNRYRNPALHAKIASTVDVASHGRLNAAIGAGWYAHEWRAYGYGFPELRDRLGRFREACDIIHRMWTEDKVLRRHCEEWGRNCGDIIKSTNLTVHLVDRMRTPNAPPASIRS